VKKNIEPSFFFFNLHQRNNIHIDTLTKKTTFPVQNLKLIQLNSNNKNTHIFSYYPPTLSQEVNRHATQNQP